MLVLRFFTVMHKEVTFFLGLVGPIFEGKILENTISPSSKREGEGITKSAISTRFCASGQYQQ